MNTNIEMMDTNNRYERGSFSRALCAAPLAIAPAAVANTVLYLVAGTFWPEVVEWPGASIGRIISANIIYLLIAAVLIGVIARISSQPARHYLIVATIGLLLSMTLPVMAGMGYGPSGTPPASLITVIVLEVMHLISYSISVPLYLRSVLGEGRS